MKKAIKVVLLVLLVLVVGGMFYIEMSLPDLSKETNRRIHEALKADLQDLKGIEGYASNGDIKIWYESILPQDSVKGSVLLIMGIGNDALAWPNYFIDGFLEKGYHVIRMDNRDTGMSTWLENWTKENAYTLEDMAQDAVAVLDELGIEKTNIVGISLGGMISQTFAIQHSERLNTLTSIMSSGYMMDETLPSINKDVVKNLTLAQIKYGVLKSEKNSIKRSLIARKLLQGSQKYDLDIEAISQTVLYNERERRGMNSQSTPQQGEAVVKSGSRYAALKKLTVPTFVVHGTSDPLIDFSHGKKYFDMLPNSEKFWVEGMGHTLPAVFGKPILEKIDSFIEKQGR